MNKLSLMSSQSEPTHKGEKLLLLMKEEQRRYVLPQKNPAKLTTAPLILCVLKKFPKILKRTK